jgi:cytochrome c peroxidase
MGPNSAKASLGLTLLLLFSFVAACWALEVRLTEGSAQQQTKKSQTSGRQDQMTPESSAARSSDWERPYPQYQAVGTELLPYPDLRPGDMTPTDLYRYGGLGQTSYASVDDVGDFQEFYLRLSQQKPKVMGRWNSYLESRYRFTGKLDREVTMSRNKPLPLGPVTRLPQTIGSWEDLASLSPQEIRTRDLFPEGFRPLAHPLQSTGHMLFPEMWIHQHPEHDRFDVSFDIPNEYLPEFPPPLFLTTRPDLGDVSRGREVTQANFRELFDGVLTPEQMEGLRLLVTKFPTSWFNQSKHRLTPAPSRGVACFDCHVNGHTNGAIELDPSTRPTLARARLDTPTLRGNHNNLLFSLKRSIRSTDHFAEVEEYFDGDISLQLQIGGRQLDKVSTNRMGDFNSIIGLPPAPKLDRLGHLDPSRAQASELRGEKLFFEKARCSQCHPAPFYTDNSMHDLHVEEFYQGRAEGWVKTFSLRGIKDSPPYFHDGRLPTLEDSVEFFNIIFGIKLSSEEKKDLVSFLRCL